MLSSYNELGLVAERDGPCYYGPTICSTSGYERYSYDELGRLVGLVHADGSITKTTHTNLTTTYYDELNNQRSIVQDQLGRLTRSVGISDGGHKITAKFEYAPSDCSIRLAIQATIPQPSATTSEAASVLFRIRIEAGTPSNGPHSVNCANRRMQTATSFDIGTTFSGESRRLAIPAAKLNSAGTRRSRNRNAGMFS